MAKVCWIVVGPPPLLTRLPKGSSTALTFSSMTPKSEKQNRSVVLKKNVTNGAEYSGQFDEIKNNKNVLVCAMWFLLAEVSTLSFQICVCWWRAETNMTKAFRLGFLVFPRHTSIH